MEKTNYELERDEQVKQNREVFLSMGIQVLALNLRDACSKGGKRAKQTAYNLKTLNLILIMIQLLTMINNLTLMMMIMTSLLR